ncbi:hypothetical protein ES703_46554 [subsurface metagenome]
MKYKHREAVKLVADELVLAGLVGRADHIGAHPFQDNRQRLLVATWRPDIVIRSHGRTYIIEIEVGTGLHHTPLLDRVNALLELEYWVGIICHKKNIQALRWAFYLNMSNRMPMIDTEKKILEILYKKLKLPDRYVRSQHNAK